MAGGRWLEAGGWRQVAGVRCAGGGGPAFSHHLLQPQPAPATCLQPPASSHLPPATSPPATSSSTTSTNHHQPGGWRQVAGGRRQVAGCRQVAGGRWLEAVVLGGGMLRYSAVRTGSIGSVRGHRISDISGSVSDTLRYAIKVLLKQPC